LKKAKRVRALSRFTPRSELARDQEIVRIRVKELSLHRPRQLGAYWLAVGLWEQLGLDRLVGATGLERERLFGPIHDHRVNMGVFTCRPLFATNPDDRFCNLYVSAVSAGPA
jgi:hypothetical protein